MITYPVKFLAVLGSEYCSGYFDSLKNWNNGFYCPSVEDSIGEFNTLILYPLFRGPYLIKYHV